MIRFAALPLALAVTAAPLLAQATLTPADQSAAFRAAGFKLVGAQWQACGDPGTAGYTSGAIESVADLNGDGRPEAVVTEGSTFCYGNTGQSYTIVSKQADGSWKGITEGAGMVGVLDRKGAGVCPTRYSDQSSARNASPPAEQEASQKSGRLRSDRSAFAPTRRALMWRVVA